MSVNNSYCLSFDGSMNDYVLIPYNSAHAPKNGLTMECWIYNDDWNNITKAGNPFSKTQAGGFGFSIGSLEKINFIISLNTDGSYNAVNAPFSDFKIGWNYIAGTFDGRYIKMYLNGELKDTNDIGSVKTIYYRYNNPICIGNDSGTDGVDTKDLGFLGKVDEASLWNRALTQDEIQLYMNKKLTGEEKGLVGYWELDKGVGTIAYDKTPLGVNGDIYGAKWDSDTVDLEAIEPQNIITLNPSDKGSGVILSNNNLTAERPQVKGVRATVGKSQGKWYWETYIDKHTDVNYSALVMNEERSLEHTPYGNSTVGYDGKTTYFNDDVTSKTGSYVHDGTDSRINDLPKYTTGDTLGVAIDLDTTPRKITFFKNGEFVIEGKILFDGKVFPAVGSGGSTGGVTTINFGATPFKYEVPNEYLPYDIDNADWIFKNKYLVQDNNKIKKTTMEGLEEIGNAPVTVEMFEEHGIEDLSEIIGAVNRDFNMIYKEELEDMKLFRYKLVGYEDLENLKVK